MRYIFILTSLLIIACDSPTPPDQTADGAIRGTVLPGAASGNSGSVIVVANRNNDPMSIDWQRQRDGLSGFGDYEIKELKEGQYFILVHLDANRNGERDAGEYWGGYDGNGDNRLDAVKLIGGETITVDATFFAQF